MIGYKPLVNIHKLNCSIAMYTTYSYVLIETVFTGEGTDECD